MDSWKMSIKLLIINVKQLDNTLVIQIATLYKGLAGTKFRNDLERYHGVLACQRQL
jgi:hypothetical protein